MKPLTLERGAVLVQERSRAHSVFFLESGTVSPVAGNANGDCVEVAVIGHEGVAGVVDVLGRHRLPYSLKVQIPGSAVRVAGDVCRELIPACPTLHDLVMAYSQIVMHQLAQSAMCSRFHSAVQRLSR